MSKSIFFIAEISANHCGKFENAKKLILTAKKFGADAVKLQTYSPDTMTLNLKKKQFRIHSGLWKGSYLWDVYNKGQTPLAWHKKLFLYAKKIGIKIFSTPFDETAVDFLEKLNCPIYKISSFEMTDLLLIKKASKTKKPIIISTGMATVPEIEDAYYTAKKNGAKEITLLYCVSNYPSKNNDFNLNYIKFLKKKFNCKVGLSDHSNDNRIAMLSIAAGAEVIEKHIALENQKKGLDIEFSLKGNKIKDFRQSIDLANDLFKSKINFNSRSDADSRKFRRSIFVTSDIKAGERFNTSNIKKLRPGSGLEPKYYAKLLGKVSPNNFKKGDPLPKSISNIIK